jgi:hypothetical protein
MDREQVTAAIERIATSDGFAQSERLCRFLRFTVQAVLDGKAGEIKEYVIGREVFDRPGDYDPRTDPIVRVEARRLRKKLDEYYEGPGANEPIRIAYPKGSYVPEIAAPEKPANRRAWLWGGVAAAAAVGAVIWRPRSAGQKVVVLPARWTWKNEDFTQTPHDVDIAERTGAVLANQHGVAVAAWPLVQKYSSGANSRQIARELNATRILLIAVRVEASGARVTAYQIDAATDRKMHVADFENVDVSTAQQRAELAHRIAATYRKN